MATLVQKTYRLYPNNDGIQPSSPYAIEDRKAGNFLDATSYRVRVSIENTGTALNASTTAFKLQYAVAGTGANALADGALSGATWIDIGGIGSGVIWRGADNATPVDGAVISSGLLTGTTVLGHYVESGTSPVNTNAVNTNDIIEYDWVINTNVVALGTYYVFRVVESAGTLLSSYSVYPRLATINTPADHEQHQWAVVDDVEAIITGEDLTTYGVSVNDTFRFRIMHKDGGAFISGGILRVKYYNNYANMLADTGGTFIAEPGAATTEDWEWWDDATTGNWWNHGTSVPAVVTSDHGPEPGVSLEKSVLQGDAYLLDWTAIGSNTGPEHNFSLKFLGTVADISYLFRIELDGVMLPLSSMHYGTNKSVMFVSGAAPPPEAGGYSSDLTDIATDFASNAGWTALGGGQAGMNAPETDYFNQGNNCISKNAFAGANKGMIYNAGATTIAPGDALFMWITHLTPNSLDVEAGTPGGLQVLIGSSAGDYYGYDTRGSDTIKDGAPWICMVVDPTTTADDTTGTPTTVTSFFGGSANLPVTGPTKGAPLGIDAFRHGRAFIVTGGDLSGGYTNFDGAALYNDAIIRKYGQFQSIDGGYLLQGLFRIGTSTPADFRDSNRSILINRTNKVASTFNGIEINNSGSNIEWTNITITALGTNSRGYLDVVDNPILLFESCVFVDMDYFRFWSKSTINNTTFRRCQRATIDYAKFNNCIFEESTDTSAILAPTLKYLSGCTFSSDGSSHAIELNNIVESAMDWDNTLVGYDVGTSGSPVTPTSTGNEAIYVNSTQSADLTINIQTGASIPSIRVGAGFTGNVNVVTGTVPLTVKALTTSGATIQDCRVLVLAGATGPFPSAVVVTITSATTTATVTHTAHGLSNGDEVMIRGANENNYNGIRTISNVTTNTYDYTIIATASPATGTITSTFVFINGLTDADGEITDSRNYIADQLVSGRVRKSSASPYYKTGQIVGTVNKSTGVTISVIMLSDE